jgi:hypothetical protein
MVVANIDLTSAPAIAVKTAAHDILDDTWLKRTIDGDFDPLD